MQRALVRGYHLSLSTCNRSLMHKLGKAILQRGLLGKWKTGTVALGSWSLLNPSIWTTGVASILLFIIFPPSSLSLLSDVCLSNMLGVSLEVCSRLLVWSSGGPVSRRASAPSGIRPTCRHGNKSWLPCDQQGPNSTPSSETTRTLALWTTQWHEGHEGHPYFWE